MTVISDGRQHLDFDASWSASKWDESPAFVGSFEQALHNLAGEGVKAADAVGVRIVRGRSTTLLIAEFKDFNRPGATRRQQEEESEGSISDKLARNIVRKVVDTLCGATFAHDAQDQRPEELASWRQSLGRPTTALLVLICVEVAASQAVAAGPWTKKLKGRLRWLGPDTQVLVTNGSRPFAGGGLRYRVE